MKRLLACPGRFKNSGIYILYAFPCNWVQKRKEISVKKDWARQPDCIDVSETVYIVIELNQFTLIVVHFYP